jgi:hypothetical protein
MKTRLTPRFAQFIHDAVAKHLAGRPQGACVEGDGEISDISLAIRDELLNLQVSLMFHRLPNAGAYKSLQLVDEHEIEGLILAEFHRETGYGVNLLEAAGGGGLVLRFDERCPDTNSGRVSVIAWGWFEPILNRLAAVLSNVACLEESK